MINPAAVEVPMSVQEDESMDISPIEPNSYALALARTYCRTQMTKIVLEVLYLLVVAIGVFLLTYLRNGIQVDAVADDPSIASALGKPTPFQSPDVFRARLPVPKVVPTVDTGAGRTVPKVRLAVDTEAGKTATHSAFAALRLTGLNETHLYYRDAGGNIRLSVCSDLQTWVDRGIVAGQQEVSINSPVCATTRYNDGKTVSCSQAVAQIASAAFPDPEPAVALHLLLQQGKQNRRG